MKSLLLTLFVLPTLVYAQNGKDNQAKFYLNRLQHFGKDAEFDNISRLSGLSATELKEYGIRTVTIQRGRRNKRKTSVRYTLNEQGLINKIEHSKDTVLYTYVQDSLIETIKVNGKNEKLSTYEYESGLLKKKEVFKNDRLYSRLLMDYTEDRKVDFSLLQNGRKLKKSYSMDYQYENGKIRRQQFICNNRLVRTWDYSCEPKGEVMSEKTTSTLCKVVEENNDGSYVTHIRKVENGEVLLYAHYYTKDSVNYASTCEKETGEKVWSTKREGNTRTSINYNRKGKVYSKTVWVFGKNDRVLEVSNTYGRKQKGLSKTKYVYDEKGLITSMTSFYKGKESYFREYIYN